MEMVVMSPPGADPLQPRAIGAGLAAQRAFDRRVDEDARDLGTARDGFKESPVLRAPHRRVDVIATGRDDIR